MLAADSRMRLKSRVVANFAAKFLCAVIGAALLSGCGGEPDGAAGALLRAFDALCVATLFDEDTFHVSVSLFDDDADPIPTDVLQLISPIYTAGYYLSDDQGDRLDVVMGLTRLDDIESRNCGIISFVGFDDAKALVANSFPIELVDQFDQGVSEFAVFQGSLVGYAGNMAISVQSGYEITTVSIYELPDG